MQPPRPKMSRGFSLTELIVVLGIVTVMASVALPSVQEAREAARRTTCSNNLKILALAMHNYHDTHRTFPPAWTSTHAEAAVQPRAGWLRALLPYADQSRLYNDLYKAGESLPPDSLTQTVIKEYRCPSDNAPDTNPLRGNYGTSNYSGNFGPVAPPRWLPGRLSADWPGHAPTPTATDGIMWLNSKLGLRDIPDGSSNTLLAGERCYTSGAGIWAGVGGNHFENDQMTDCSPGNEINSGFAAFSSRHPGGAQFVLVDGRVRFLSQKIESKAGTGASMGTFQKLSHRQDGQQIDSF